jgi:hypothetical protein
MVEHTVINERIEHFKVIGKNKSIVLESNRPLFRNRGLKHRKPDFKLIEGTVDFIGSLDVLIEEILKVVESDN